MRAFQTPFRSLILLNKVRKHTYISLHKMNDSMFSVQDKDKLNESTRRNTAIEALRFLSIFQICLWHMSYPVTVAGFLGVEFFFILAGIFLYKNATKVNSPGVVGYSLHSLAF